MLVDLFGVYNPIQCCNRGVFRTKCDSCVEDKCSVSQLVQSGQVCVFEHRCLFVLPYLRSFQEASWPVEGLWCNMVEFTDRHCPLTVKSGKRAGLNSQEKRSPCVGISLSPVSMRARSKGRRRGAQIGNKGSSKKKNAQNALVNLSQNWQQLACAEKVQPHSSLIIVLH